MIQIQKVMRYRFGNNRGFTLIEVIAVLITIGIIAVVIVSRGSSTSTYSVKSQAAALKSHIRYAQTMAMSTNSTWRIDVIDSKRYSLFSETKAKTVILPGADSDPVVLGAKEPLLSTGTVSFDENGSPAGVLLFTVSMDGETETITITPNTGFIQ